MKQTVYKMYQKDERLIEAAKIAPSERQLKWQQMEFYSFIHFGINTFTDREWGTGSEDPALFNPVGFDAGQWVEVCKSAGMTGLILTCKHHDGFCLWPSRYTDHSVKSSPWKDGKGDVVREVSDACRKAGLKFGIYLSPWDRHERSYGTDAYNTYYTNQLRELLTQYGDIFCVWLDGACGEGPNGKRQVYDWNKYYSVIRELQPDAVISVCGPDVRWCGNEAGHCRTSEWSVVPASLRDAEKVQEKSQKADDREFAKRVDTQDDDLGSRNIIQNADELIWYPAEVNTSIHPGWFYHANEDNKVKPVDELLKIYYGSVGGNANFLLNIPPDKRGLIHEADAAVLKNLGHVIRETFKTNLAAGAVVRASETMCAEHDVNNILDGRTDTYWCPKEGTGQAVIDVDLDSVKAFDRVVLMEHIQSGQRVEVFSLEYWKDDHWNELYQGTVIGYKKICCFDKVETDKLRINIKESRWYPTLSALGVHMSADME